MNFTKTTLSNGLRVILTPMLSMESATVQIAVNAGTRNEKKKVNGIAHFLEHMVFKGTEKYPSAQAISSAIDSIGAEANANTGKERTAFHIKAWERHLSLAFDILSSFIKSPLLDPKEIERESGVIIQEIAMYEDLPMQKAPSIFEELLYEPTSLGWDIVGKKETVEAIKKEDFVGFMRKLYTPQSMVLSIAGKFNKDAVLKLAEDYFGDIKGRGEVKIVKETDKAPEDNLTKKPEVKLVNKKTEQTHMVLGVRAFPLRHVNRYRASVLGTILGGGMSSRLFTEIRERRGLAYYVRGEIGDYTDKGYFAVRAGIRNEAAEEAVKVILAELEKTTRPGEIKEVELSKAKEYLKGRIALGLEDTHAVADFYGDQELFEGDLKSIDDIIKKIDEVTIEDVVGLAKELFVEKRLNLAMIGPDGDKEKFEQLLKL